MSRSVRENEETAMNPGNGTDVPAAAGLPDGMGEAPYRLAEHAGLGMCYTSPAGRVHYLNPALRRLLDLAPAAEAAGLELQQFYGAEEREKLERDILPAVRQLGAWSGELPLAATDGRKLPVWLDIRIVPDAAGSLQALACSFTDLQLWKRLEQDLRDSADHQRTLVDYIPQRVFFKDLQSRYLAANRRYAADLEIEPEDIIGRDDYAFHPGELAEHYRRVDQRVMVSGVAEEIDESYVRDGGEYTIHTVKTPVRSSADGQIIGVCGIFWDVSEQRRLESRLKESEATLRAIYEHALEGIMVASVETGKLTMANPAICRMLGYSEAELLTMSPPDLHPPQILPRLKEIFACMARGEFSPVQELPFLRKDGGEVHLDASATLVAIGGKPGFLGVFRDVTERRQAREKLARSEALLAEAQSLAHLGNWNHDLTTGQTTWSDEMFRLLGHEPGTVTPSRAEFLLSIPPADREAVLAAMQQTLTPGENGPFRFEHRILRPDGERIVEHEWRIVGDALGTPLRIHGAMLDITERRAAQARAEMLQRVADNSTQGIGWADLDGTVHYFNQALRRLLALGADEDLRRYSFRDFYAAAQNLDLQERILPSVMESGHWTGELDIRARDGRIIPTLHNVFLIRDGMGRPLALANMLTDLGERRRTEAELARYRDRLEELVRERSAELDRQSQRNATILNVAIDGFFAADIDSRLIDVNPAFCAMLGYTRGELLALRIQDVEAVEDAAEVAAHIERVRSHGHDRFETRHRRKDGSVVDVEISVSRVEIAGEIQFFAIARDISERKGNEAKLLASRQEAERANAAKSEFLSRMSHELRTPLNAIIGFAQLLEIMDTPPLSPQQEENVREILKAGQHLLTQVNEVLDLARIESGRIELSIETVALAPLVADCIGQLRPLATRRAIAVAAELAPGLALKADPGQLKLVLLNLLSNAIKFNRSGGRVDIRAATATNIRIEVSDTGRGIAAAHLERLFRPFERLESSYEGIEGTGIGLALVKKLVEAMDGTVGVDSQVGSGSTFWFELPAACQPAAPPNTGAKVGAGSAAPATHAATRKTVLYIEDNPSNLKLVRKLLELRRQIDIHEATDAERGLELARSTQPDLILLDINLPGMDGFAALRALRADPALRAVPVVAVTANAMKRDVERCLAAGFDDYLAKPFDVATFLQTIDRRLAANTKTSSE
jgi:hypothetical protein